MTEPTRHETVRVVVGDLAADIDTMIAPLIRAMWVVGIRTIFSCENAGDMGQETHRGWVQVQFERMMDATGFLNRVTRFEPGGKALYNRISHDGCKGVRCWDYEVYPFDSAFNKLTETHAGVPAIDFRVVVYFPQGDLPVILDRLASD